MKMPNLKVSSQQNGDLKRIANSPIIIKAAKDVLKNPKKKFILKGKVRTNRRFEIMLQMKKMSKK